MRHKPSLNMQVRKPYPSFGQCIYCMEKFEPDQLTDEHVVPFALNGTFLLSKAACKNCAQNFNQRFEQPALRGAFLVPRLLLDLKRRKKNVARQLPKVALGPRYDVRTATRSDLKTQLSARDYPPTTAFLMFRPPGKLVGIDRGSVFNESRVAIIPGLKSPLYDHRRHITEDNQTGRVTTYVQYDASSFLTTLAKIGYCFTIMERGINGFDGKEIRQLLNKERDDVFNFVGNDDDGDDLGGFRVAKPSSYIHQLSLEMHESKIVAVVQLFASFGTPSYQVVVGHEVTT